MVPVPKNVPELKAYVRALNYYNYLPKLSIVLEPYHRLLKKEITWDCGADQKKAFEKAKKMLCSAPLLMQFDPSKAIVVYMDASLFRLVVVMIHGVENRMTKPVFYISRTLSASEKKLCTQKKKRLGRCVHSYKAPSIYMREFLHVINRPLLWFFAENKPIALLSTWTLFLAVYKYSLDY